MPYASKDRQRAAQRESVNRRRAARRATVAVNAAVEPPVEPAPLPPPILDAVGREGRVEPPVEPEAAFVMAGGQREQAAAQAASSPPPPPPVEPSSRPVVPMGRMNAAVPRAIEPGRETPAIPAVRFEDVLMAGHLLGIRMGAGEDLRLYQERVRAAWRRFLAVVS
jgi:hypothetical protein